MKGGVGAMLMATKILQLEEVPLQGSLVTNFVSDEEKSGALGAGYLMENGYYSPDMVVVGEITNGNRIALAEKGGVLFRLRTRGRSAHASTPWTGINAIEKMAAILHQIGTRLIPALRARPSGQLPPPSMSFGTIRGGVATNVVADACEVLIDRRTLPGESVESATREIQETIEEAKRADPEIDASLEVLWSAPAFETPPDEQICQVARRTVDELGLESDFVGYEQLSDARFFAEKGIPVIIIGPGMAHRGHSPNERLELDQYLDAIKIYALLAINALATSGL
jgi:succinyl-diaminopimelate desuccinylase